MPTDGNRIMQEAGLKAFAPLLDGLRDAGDGDEVSVVSGNPDQRGYCGGCDLFIGHRAVGVYKAPDWPEPDLTERCWGCGRTQAEIDVHAPKFVYPEKPTPFPADDRSRTAPHGDEKVGGASPTIIFYDEFPPSSHMGD